jgi:hypothetical protein
MALQYPPRSTRFVPFWVTTLLLMTDETSRSAFCESISIAQHPVRIALR